MKSQQNEILFKDLSYQVVGALFDVYKSLGSNYQEKYCQKAVEIYLKKRKILFRREVPVEIVLEGEKIGRHFLDFLIDDKIILELKMGNYQNDSDIKQLMMYLKTTKLRLGILAHFGNNGVKYKRLINSQI